jgi:hypothetical protein
MFRRRLLRILPLACLVGLLLLRWLAPVYVSLGLSGYAALELHATGEYVMLSVQTGPTLRQQPLATASWPYVSIHHDSSWASPLMVPWSQGPWQWMSTYCWLGAGVNATQSAAWLGMDYWLAALVPGLILIWRHRPRRHPPVAPTQPVSP